jgi:DNA-binding NtrC family response regulator
MSRAILVIEDEPLLAKNIASYLAASGYDVRIASSAEQGLGELESFKPDAILLDFNLPGMNGLEAIERLRAADPRQKVVMMTGHASVDLAVQAMKAGAYDFLTKPVSLSKLGLMIEKLTGEERQSEALAYYRARDARASGLDKLIGGCPAMVQLRAAIARVIAGDEALKDASPPAVLVTGETGTGKELVARALHFEGPRRSEPFVEINCAAIPSHLLESELFGYERGAFTDAKSRKPGLVETADRGTLFLDEIGDMDLSLQVKLLRLLEDRSMRRVGGLREQVVNVRIIAATHRRLEAQVAEGRFRADLFYRIRMVHLELPALRDRGPDILLLANHFLALHAKRYGREGLELSADARQSLLRHRWPGNVRELRNVIEQAVLMAAGPVIQASDLGGFQAAGRGAAEGPSSTAGSSLDRVERDALIEALEACHWNVSQAARVLGVTRDTLRYRMEKHDLAARKPPGADSP